MSKTEKYNEFFREDFIKNLKVDFFDDEEIDAVLKDLDSLERGTRQRIFALCHTLSQGSSSLVPGALKRIKSASRQLSPRDFERWLSHAYDLLDHGGIGKFIDFLSRIDDRELLRFRTQKGLQLNEVITVLETYLKGISGLDLKISPGKETCTDTAAVYLPPSVNAFEERERNFLAYKFMVTYLWAQIAQGTLLPDERMLRSLLVDNCPDHPDIQSLFSLFQEKRLAIDIYTLIESVRLESFMQTELPGLMKHLPFIKKIYLKNRPSLTNLSGKTLFIEGLYKCYLQGYACPEIFGPLKVAAEDMFLLRRGASLSDSLSVLFRIYETALMIKGDYDPPGSFPFPGTIKPDMVSLQLKAWRRAMKQRIEAVVTKIINLPDFEAGEKMSPKAMRHEHKPDAAKEYLIIKGRPIEADELLKEVIEERGGIPGGILVKGADLGGAESPILLTDLLEEEDSPEDEAGGIKYDEWDYKRAGYKKKWCTLYEKPLHPDHEPFVQLTLGRYKGSVNILRRKFELLKREPRIIRRQKEGDDIDIDAAIEAFSDMTAGLSPEENLFTKYDRQVRAIAVLFLLDMSGSTKGWVHVAEKEALVIMAEALEALGDRYGIFGFSGMTRNRCDYYVIKEFEEPYSAAVKSRISGIAPKDYTRMGPPIRHSIKQLKEVEARTKLLITISDGKPEDYDAYKGNYSIEDTRKALIEAKEQGIHSFCITIDKEAGSYLKHMYGEVNYIVIDDVKKLPLRISEIYRRLTT